MDESTLRADQQDTTYIINTESGVETARLIQQAREINRVVGLFPMGMDQIHEDATLLDIGSGTGDWCLDVAFEMPLACVVGIDLSQTQVEYATARARTQLLDNISFEVVDALKELGQWSDA
ncbi:MAG TPA: methyltransferase domain-containing protein, partial [Ktedonobacteraceae bacterium]|nr:methyltransferase domain-containing protein [Ktedonobacteraceae bacterium]